MSRSPREKYIDFLRLFADRLKPAGFRRRGNAIARRRNCIWHLLAFQRSHQGTRARILFTLNVGVASERLLSFFDSPTGAFAPDVGYGSLRLRMNDLLPPAHRHRDWWIVDDATDVESLDREFVAYADVLHSFFDRAGSSDIALRDFLRHEVPTGLTSVERLMHLTALQRLTGDQRLEQTLTELVELAGDDPYVRPAVEIHQAMLDRA